LAFLAEAAATDGLVDMGSFSSVGEIEQDLLVDENRFVADEAMLSADDPTRPFPSFFAMALVWKLGRTQVAARSTWPSIRVLATTDDDDVTTVVFGCYRPWRGDVDELDVSFDWTGLPERFAWRQWQVDARHSRHGRLELVASGDETDIPLGVRIGALGVGCIQLTAKR